MGSAHRGEHGVVYEPATLAGFLAEEVGDRVGLLTYRVVEVDACEVVTIDAFELRRGIGTALMDAVVALGNRRVWLVTTNDNVPAQRFYEHISASSPCARASSNVRACSSPRARSSA